MKYFTKYINQTLLMMMIPDERRTILACRQPHDDLLTWPSNTQNIICHSKVRIKIAYMMLQIKLIFMFCPSAV